MIGQSRKFPSPKVLMWAIAITVALAAYFILRLASMRQIVDGTNGKPLANVFVILAFKGDVFAGVESRYRCYRLDVVKTDANGRFPFPTWRRSFNPFLSDAHVQMTLYKAGYRAQPQIPAPGKPFEMIRDTRPWRSNPPFGIVPTKAFAEPTYGPGAKMGPPPPPKPPEPEIEGRDASLQSIVSQITRCGSPVDKRKERLLAAMDDEVRSMKNVDWGFVSNLLYEMETIESGGDPFKFESQEKDPSVQTLGDLKRVIPKSAHERYSKREEQLHEHSRDLGVGPLWELPSNGVEK